MVFLWFSYLLFDIPLLSLGLTWIIPRKFRPSEGPLPPLRSPWGSHRTATSKTRRWWEWKSWGNHGKFLEKPEFQCGKPRLWWRHWQSCPKFITVASEPIPESQNRWQQMRLNCLCWQCGPINIPTLGVWNRCSSQSFIIDNHLFRIHKWSAVLSGLLLGSPCSEENHKTKVYIGCDRYSASNLRSSPWWCSTPMQFSVAFVRYYWYYRRSWFLHTSVASIVQQRDSREPWQCWRHYGFQWTGGF